MDDRTKYVAIEIWFTEDTEDEYEALKELEDHLQMNGYDYYMSNMPGFQEILVLLINEEQTGYIDTVLEDRNIKYEYK